jgi:hypothetical protein
MLAPVRRLIARLCDQVIVLLQRGGEVARFDGIILSDMRTDDEGKSLFAETLLASLRLLKDVDPRRFRRVQRHITWVTSRTLPNGGASYHYSTRTCYIDFEEPDAVRDRDHVTGWHACVLVHEATHGVIRSRGILYTPEWRERIERLCVHEEQRFVRRLATINPDLAAELREEFDPRNWHWSWTATPFQKLCSVFKRLSKR